jgi:DNA-binding transcriptional regulator YiaG
MTDATPSQPASRRRPGRAERAARPAPSTARYRHLQHRFTPSAVVSEDELEAIHQTSLQILEEMGMDFMHDGAREILRQAGAEVRPGSERVRIPRELILQAIKTCPSEFTLHARNPERNVAIGGKNLAFAQVASPPNCSDMQGGRRAGNQVDFRNMVKLAQRYDIVHCSGGYPVEPVDLHSSVRHLDCLSDIAKLTDKAFHAYSLGQARNLDGLEIARIARGISAETVATALKVGIQTVKNWRSIGVPERRKPHVAYFMSTWQGRDSDSPELRQNLVLRPTPDQFDRWNDAALAEGKRISDWAISGLDKLADEHEAGGLTIHPGTAHDHAERRRRDDSSEGTGNGNGHRQGK